MATLELKQPMLAQISGLPKPNPTSEDRYRYYACELKWNAWVCSPTTQKTWEPTSGTLATSLIPILKWTPQFLDPLVLKYKVTKPVILKPSQNQS